MAWPENVRRGDLEIRAYRGSGPGGQNKNKRDTCVRIRHKPTGLVATAEEGRTQGENRRRAFVRLAKRLAPLMVAAARGEAPPPRPTTRVRTYHGLRNAVTDHRLPGVRFGYADVLEGDGLERIHAALHREGAADENGEAPGWGATSGSRSGR